MTDMANHGLDFIKLDEPEPDTAMKPLLIGWLKFERSQFIRKLRDLDPEQAASHSVPPVGLSVLGLVRHMTQMEHVYLSWGLGGGERHMVYGDDDFDAGSAETYQADLSLYLAEVDKADVAISNLVDLDSEGIGHGWSLGATLIKMVSEYSLHNGQAHMLRYAALGEIVR
jgi:hypothetical protein